MSIAGEPKSIQTEGLAWQNRQLWMFVESQYVVMVYTNPIGDHLACAKNRPNVSTAQVITLQTQINAQNGRKR